MNERIRLLAEQAGMVKILRQHAHEYGAGTFEDTEYPELEKFAELIVQHCIGVCEEMAAQCGGLPGDGALARDCANWIRKDFGVES
jgi:hypothetical protein